MIYSKKKKVLIKLNYACNNNCLFCWTEKLGENVKVSSSIKEIFRKIDMAKGLGIDTIVLTGGEPTIHKGLVKISRYVKGKGFSLGLATNARMLSYEKLLDKLILFDLDFLHISFFSHKKETHNKISRSDSFEQTIEGIKNVINNNLDAIINLIVQKSNIRSLKETVDFLIKLGVKKIRFSLVEPVGMALKNIEAIPKLDEVAPRIIEAVEYGISKKIVIGFDGLPLCLIKKYKDLFTDLRGMGIEYMSEAFEHKFFPVDHNNRVKIDNCKGCKIKKCPGIFKGYVKLLGKEKINEWISND